MDTNPACDPALELSTALWAVVATVGGIVENADVPTRISEDLLEAMRAISCMRGHIDGLDAHMAGEIDHRSEGEDSLARSQGCRNAIDLVRRYTGASARTAASRIHVGSELAHCPVLAGQVNTGMVPMESALLITHTLSNARSSGAGPEALARAEQDLVDLAANPLHHADSVRGACRGWDHKLAPQGLADQEREQMRRRHVHLTHSHNGMVTLRGELLPEVGATLARLFDAINSPQTHTNTEDSTDGVTDGGGTEASVAGDSRSPGQKRHDAFAIALNLASGCEGAPTLGGAPITVIIHTTQADLDNPDGAGWVDGFDGTPTPITMSAVNRGACAGSVQHLLRNSQGRITGLGNPGRIFNATQRRAIAARDGGCIIPGCDTPATWCEIHHVHPHARGGPTHTDNGVTLCYYHHRTIDTSGWNIRMINGIPHVQAPPTLDPTHKWTHPTMTGTTPRLL